MTGREDAVALFRRRFGGEPEVLVGAPGRVNLIGEHTDYNDGFVLPTTIAAATWIAASAGRDDRLELVSALAPDDPTVVVELARPEAAQGWAAYIGGVAWALAGARLAVPGWQGAVATDIPIGAGLSSSAALEIAAARVCGRLAGWSLDPVPLARLAQRAEVEVVGVPCGIMDQLAVAAAKPGQALLVDCRSLTLRSVPLPKTARVVVVDTGTRRALVDSAYADRRAACERVATEAGVAALRDLTIGELTALADGAGRSPGTGLDPVDQRRARHVISENDRVLEFVAALEAGQLEAAGRLMVASHQSLRDDYEVSSPALDAAVATALAAPGCLGARLTGAGFAGCAVVLVETAQLAAFRAAVPGCLR